MLGEQPRLAGRVPHEDPSLLGRLDVRLEVAPDAVSDGNEIELVRVEDVPVGRGELQQAVGEAIVVLLLLHRVVERRVTQVLLPVGDEELFKLLMEIDRVKGGGACERMNPVDQAIRDRNN